MIIPSRYRNRVREMWLALGHTARDRTGIWMSAYLPPEPIFSALHWGSFPITGGKTCKQRQETKKIPISHTGEGRLKQRSRLLAGLIDSPATAFPRTVLFLRVNGSIGAKPLSGIAQSLHLLLFCDQHKTHSVCLSFFILQTSKESRRQGGLWLTATPFSAPTPTGTAPKPHCSASHCDKTAFPHPSKAAPQLRGGPGREILFFLPLMGLTAWTVASQKQTLFSGRQTCLNLECFHEYLWLFSLLSGLSFGHDTRFPFTACRCLIIAPRAQLVCSWGKQTTKWRCCLQLETMVLLLCVLTIVICGVR